MSTNSSNLYYERAEDSAREAGECELDNVRERWLRSEAAWRDMADRALRGERKRDRLVAEKAAERAAECETQPGANDDRSDPETASRD